MNKQPYALRLADDLRAAPERTRTSFEAADELRRLYEQNDRFADGILSMGRRIAALEAVNGELLEAIQDILDTGFTGGPQGKRARAAIAKAKGEQL